MIPAVGIDYDLCSATVECGHGSGRRWKACSTGLENKPRVSTEMFKCIAALLTRPGSFAPLSARRLHSISFRSQGASRLSYVSILPPLRYYLLHFLPFDITMKIRSSILLISSELNIPLCPSLRGWRLAWVVVESLWRGGGRCLLSWLLTTAADSDCVRSPAARNTIFWVGLLIPGWLAFMELLWSPFKHGSRVSVSNSKSLPCGSR